MEEKLKDAEDIVEKMEKEALLSKVEELIKDNKIVFDYKEKKYRVRLLNLAEKEEFDVLRRRKFGQLIKDKDILLEKDLIAQYKERGVNIDEIDEQIKRLESEESNLHLQLGESISKNEVDTILSAYKDSLLEIRSKKQILKTQRILFLESSLENAIYNYVSQVLTYLSFEVLENNKWKRAFTKLEDFQTYSDDELIMKAAQYSVLLQSL
jgi:hypothetical protein